MPSDPPDVAHPLADTSPDPKSDPLGLIGKSIDGKISVGSVVGEGGFAIVYRGKHEGLDEHVAIKVLKLPHALPADDRKTFEEAFVREGRIAHRLSARCPEIVRALDVGITQTKDGRDAPYIVYDFIEGPTLEQWRKEHPEPLDPARAFRLLAGAAEALAHAHRENVAHRDVKPANILVLGDTRAPATAVTDFGIAKLLSEPDIMRALESTGWSPKAFTPRYGAPEQFDRGRGATGPWTDVFALALVFVELVCGRPAMEGNSYQLMRAASDPDARPLPKAHGTTVPKAVESVLEKALAVEPKTRFLTAHAFWAALGESLGEIAQGATGAARSDKSERGLPSTRREGARDAGDDASHSGVSEPPPRPPRDSQSDDDAGPSEEDDGESGDRDTPRTKRSGPRDDDGSDRGTPQWLAAAGLVATALVLGAGIIIGRKTLQDEARARAERANALPMASRTIFEPHHEADAGADEAAELDVDRTAPPGFTPISNLTYRYVVDIPVEFLPVREAEDPGTARHFETLDRRSHLTVDGGPRPPDITLESLFEEATKTDGELSRWITRKQITDDAFTVEGFSGHELFHRRTIVDDDRYATVLVSYPEEHRHRVEPRFAHMDASMAFGAFFADRPGQHRRSPDDPFRMLDASLPKL